MSYEAIGSGSISLNTMTAMEQKNLQARCWSAMRSSVWQTWRIAEMPWFVRLRGSIRNADRQC